MVGGAHRVGRAVLHSHVPTVRARLSCGCTGRGIERQSTETGRPNANHMLCQTAAPAVEGGENGRNPRCSAGGSVCLLRPPDDCWMDRGLTAKAPADLAQRQPLGPEGGNLGWLELVLPRPAAPDAEPFARRTAAITRSRMSSRSISRIAPRTLNSSRPVGVVVSIACSVTRRLHVAEAGAVATDTAAVKTEDHVAWKVAGSPGHRPGIVCQKNAGVREARCRPREGA